ncbi:MAG: DUF2190 family protein [Nanoarchaeota archaeon]|nr:DUF2190 family protein [Nanoarchaeota archaeon]
MGRQPAISLQQAITGTYIAEEAVYANMCVVPGSDDHQIKPVQSGGSAGAIIAGVVLSDANANDSVEVAVGGLAMCRATSSVTRGDNVIVSAYSATARLNGAIESDNSTLAEGSMVVGIALQDIATNAYGLVLLQMRRQLATS